MSRWHKDSCLVPDVKLLDNLPHCQACNTFARREDKATWASKGSEPPPAPSDPEIGDLNLWWPPGVPYHDQRSPKSDTTKDKTQTASPSYVYESSLDKSHLRILTVAPASNPGAPIYVTLDTYLHHECPEYECISYTWGGEENDITPCVPVYVGSYWDVLLQTRNCGDMLAHFRLRDRPRQLWVDAICINQEDNLDKGAQVGNMGEVYKNCTRVCVYLGRDIVHNTPKRSRRRIRIQEIDEKLPGSPLQTLLGRRYFSRVWIIQELLLAPSILIPVSTVDVIAGGGIFVGSEDRGDSWWLESKAPWLRYVCGAGNDAFPSTLLDVLDQTWVAEATNYSDKLFGILGLVNTKAPRGSPSPVEIMPDYTLSFVEVLLGIGASILLGLDRVRMLQVSGLCSQRYRTATRNNRYNMETCPSWLPDPSGSKTWSYSLVHMPDVTAARELSIASIVKLKSNSSSAMNFMFPLMSNIDMSQHARKEVGKHDYVWSDQKDMGAFTGWSTLSISARTGAMRVEAIRVFEWEHQPAKWFDYSRTDPTVRKAVAIAACETHGATVHLIMAQIKPEYLRPDHHIFVVQAPVASQSMVLFLYSTPEPGQYKLDYCRVLYDVVFGSLDKPNGPPNRALSMNFNGTLASVLDAKENIRNVTLASIFHERWQIRGGDHRYYDDFLLLLFPSKTVTLEDIAPLLIALESASEKNLKAIADLYMASLHRTCPELVARLDTYTVTLRFSYEEWTAAYTLFHSSTHNYRGPSSLIFSVNCWSWIHGNAAGPLRPRTKFGKVLREDGQIKSWGAMKPPYQKYLYIRLSLEKIFLDEIPRFRKKCWGIVDLIHRLRVFSELQEVSETLPELFARASEEKDKSVYGQGDLPECFRKDLGVVWRPETIEIV